MWDCVLVYASKICVCEHLADNFFIHTILLSSCSEQLYCSLSSKHCCHLFLGWRICVMRICVMRMKWQWSSQMSRLHIFFLVPCRIYRWGLYRLIVSGWTCVTQHTNPSVLQDMLGKGWDGSEPAASKKCINHVAAVLPCVGDAAQEGFLWLPPELERHMQRQGLSCSLCKFGLWALKVNSVFPRAQDYAVSCANS